MNTIKKAMNVVHDRSVQLEKQAKVDEHFQSMVFDCPYAVSRFLLDERKLHRQEFKDMSYLSLFSKLDFSADLLKQWDDRYKQLETVLEGSREGRCLRLSLMSKEINKVK